MTHTLPHSFPKSPRPKVSGRWAKERQVLADSLPGIGMRISTRRCYRVFNRTEHEQNLTNVTILCSNRSFCFILNRTLDCRCKRCLTQNSPPLPRSPAPISLQQSVTSSTACTVIDVIRRPGGDDCPTYLNGITDGPTSPYRFPYRILLVSLDDRWLRDSDGTSKFVLTVPLLPIATHKRFRGSHLALTA